MPRELETDRLVSESDFSPAADYDHVFVEPDDDDEEDDAIPMAPDGIATIPHFGAVVKKWSPYSCIYPGKQNIVNMLAGLPDPLGSGQMTFEVSIKPMPDDVDDNRNALSKTLYKYLYTIKMEHTVGIKRTVECSWKELFSLHGKIVLQLKARYQLYLDKRKERRQAKRASESAMRQASNDSEMLSANGNGKLDLQRSLTVDPSEVIVRVTENDELSTTQVPVSRSHSHSVSPATKPTEPPKDAQARRRNWKETGSKLRQTIRRARLFKSRSSVANSQRRDKIHFPKRPYDNYVKADLIEKRARTIQEYLNRVMNCDQKRKFRQLKEFRQMFGLSNFTYVHELGLIGFEGDMDKLSGGTSLDKSCMRIARCQWGGIIQCWRTRWILLRSSFIAVIRDGKEIRQVVLFDRSTKFEEDKRHLKYHIKNVSSHLELKCCSLYELSTWRHRFHDISQLMEKKFKNNGAGVMQSFAPYYRQDTTVNDNRVRWFLCGQAYYRRVFETIQNAKQEVFIAGWWLHPDIELVNADGVRAGGKTISDVLLQQAKNNIKVFILVYNNIESALAIGNYECAVKSFRQKASEHNCKDAIHVLYHPDARAVLLEASKKTGTGFEWAHHEKVVIIDQSVAFVGGIDIAPSRFDIHGQFPLFDEERKLWKGKDYGNHHVADLGWSQFDQDYPELNNRHSMVRCPWQDIAVQVWGPSARDVGRHFIERWNQCKRQLKKHRSDSDYPLIMPKDDHAEFIAPTKLGEKVNDPNESTIYKASTQVLRSSCQWSAGFTDLERSEKSILVAYRDIIRESKRFIYIENQFFLSTTDDKISRVKNLVSKYIADRIKKAYAKGEPYKVYIVLPEKSGFKGQLEERQAPEQELFFQLQMHSIYRGLHSIRAHLENGEHHKIFIDNYLSVCAFHKWEMNNDIIQHEAIYIHSKLLIADDEIAMIGSANINDRSLLGDRDSEVCLLIHSSDFAKSLRQRIWSCALGLNCLDGLGAPESDEFFKKVWSKTAADNSHYFYECFRNLPNNAVKSYLDTEDKTYKKWQSQYTESKNKTKDEKLKILNNVKGYLVQQQYQFGFDDIDQNYKMPDYLTSNTALNTMHSMSNVFL